MQRLTPNQRIALDDDRRINLPYGKWTCRDGREVLFNRGYKPIWERYPGQPAREADRRAWIFWVKQEWFYDDGTKDKRTPALAALRAFQNGEPANGIPEGRGPFGARTRTNEFRMFG